MMSQEIRMNVGWTSQVVCIWEPLLRLFRWLLAGLCALRFAPVARWRHLHKWFSYGIVGLIRFRCVCGLIGKRHARFSDFIHHPSVVAGILDGRHFGQCPVGRTSVIGLYVTLSAICALGVMTGLDPLWGAKWVGSPLVGATWAASALIVLKIAGVVLASLEHRRNPVRAIITGRKRSLS